jgi:hypothetical protein
MPLEGKLTFLTFFLPPLQRSYCPSHVACDLFPGIQNIAITHPLLSGEEKGALSDTSKGSVSRVSTTIYVRLDLMAKRILWTPISP